MDKNTQNILAEANRVIEEMNDKLATKKMGEDGITKDFSMGLMKQLASFIMKDEMIGAMKEAISGLKIEPKFQVPEVKIPEIKLPKIVIPHIAVPQPIVNVETPTIQVPKIEMPSDIKIKSFEVFAEKLMSFLENNLPQIIADALPNPLPVIVVDETGMPVKQPEATIKAAYPSRVGIGLAGVSAALAVNELLGTGDDVTTSFSLDYTPLDEDKVEIWVDKAKLYKGASDGFTISGKNITLTEAPPLGNKVYATYLH